MLVNNPIRLCSNFYHVPYLTLDRYVKDVEIPNSTNYDSGFEKDSNGLQDEITPMTVQVIKGHNITL